MPIEKRKVGQSKVRESETYVSNQSQGGSENQLTGWVIAIGIVLVIFIIFTFSRLNTLNSKDDIQVLETKIKTLEKKGDWEVYEVNYEGGSSTSNNLKWIGEKSLGFPEYLKGKNCYILGSKISGDDGGTIRGFLGKNDNGTSYQFATNYEARINNSEEKIEITKWNGSSSMLTKSERDNLYFSLTLLCR